MKGKHPGHKSSTDNQLMDYIYLSSSSSSNLSPLAPPFTVERSNNPNKLNSNQNPDSIWPNYYSPSTTTTTTTTTQGFSTDLIRTATTVPYANSTLSPHNNWSSMNSTNGNLFGSNVSYSNPFNSPSTYNWFSNPNPNNAPTTTHNWSSMNSSIKSGLEPLNQSADNLFGVKPNLLPTTWNFGDDSDDDDSLLNPNDFHLFRDDGPSQVDYGLNLSDLKYSGQADGSRGKEDSMFGGESGVARESNIGPSVIGKLHDTSFSATNHGFVSSGFSKEDAFTWNGHTSHYPFEARPLMYDTSSDHISTSMTRSSSSLVIKPPITLSSFSAQGAVSTKSIEISSPSKFYSNNVLVSHNLLNEKESRRPLGFEAKESHITSNLLNFETDEPGKMTTDGRLNFKFKASSNFQVPDINITKDVNSAANVSENLDHHNSSEDSPCWKGAPSQFSSPGFSVAESSQHPMKKLQKGNGEDVLLPETSIQITDRTLDQNMHTSVENAANLAKTLDVNVIVKAMGNLSELLLLHCSKDECGLKEQDHKALDHVIANLNMCMARKTQQVDPAQIDQGRNNDHFGKNIEKVQSASLIDNDLPKDYNMIQTIKEVLDENLECKEDLSSDSLLYKNLWLEAEAEMCTSSYRARFHRAKREMGKSKASGTARVLNVSEVASDIKKIPSSICSPIARKSIHEASGSKTSNTHSPNPSLPRVDDHINDVESSVMARFNILKQRGESIPVNLAEKEPAYVEASGNEIHSSGVAGELHMQNHLGEDDPVVMHSHGNKKMQYPLALGTTDVEHSVMARLNILKCRGEADPVNLERQVLADGVHAEVSEEDMASDCAGGTSLMQNQFESGFYTTYGASSDWEYVIKK